MILISAVIGIYFIIQYMKDKKWFNLFMIIMSITGVFYRKSFGIYSNVNRSTQIIIDIVYWIFVLILLAVYYKNEKDKKKKVIK